MADIFTRWDDEVSGPGTYTSWDDVPDGPLETRWDVIADTIGRGFRVVWQGVTRGATWVYRRGVRW